MSKSPFACPIGNSLDLAVTHLRRGGIVAFPTETYYGLAVDPDCSAAVTRLFAVKKRQADKPLLLLIENTAQLETVVDEVPESYYGLIKKYWPGPLTLVFPAKSTISRQLTGNTGTLGIRISPHPIARELVKRMGKPITATSANISGRLPARTAEDVAEMLGNGLDYIVDGGPTAAGLCSTVVGMKNGKLTLLRQGQVMLTEERGGETAR